MGAISDFCQKYPAARVPARVWEPIPHRPPGCLGLALRFFSEVRPTTQELEKLWAAIGGLKPVALNSLPAAIGIPRASV